MTRLVVRKSDPFVANSNQAKSTGDGKSVAAAAAKVGTGTPDVLSANVRHAENNSLIEPSSFCPECGSPIVGRAKSTDFVFAETPSPTPAVGEAAIRVLYLSIDPTNRIWMSDMEQYMPPVALGEVMRGRGIGRVVASIRTLASWRPRGWIARLAGLFSRS
jgi:hypothetical protein